MPIEKQMALAIEININKMRRYSNSFDQNKSKPKNHSTTSKMNTAHKIQFLYNHDPVLPDRQLLEETNHHLELWQPDEHQEPIEPWSSSKTETDTTNLECENSQSEILPLVKLSLQVELSNSVRSKIRALCTITLVPFRTIGSKMGISLTTVYTICQQPSTPRRPRSGRPRVLTTPICHRLIQHATLSQENRRKSPAQIVEETGIINLLL